MLKQPKLYTDVKAQVVEDYKQDMERQWVEGLRKRFSFSVDPEVLKTVNNHD